MINYKEELAAVRAEINAVDKELIPLFDRRMALSSRVANIKAKGNLAITDEAREREVIASAVAASDGSHDSEVASFARTLIALSKIRQNQSLQLSDPVDFPLPAPSKPPGVTVGFQGVSGAWGEFAAGELFPGAEKQQLEYFEDVFTAVKSGRIVYGVLPIENSQTGAIGEVYDLLRRHSCYIVGQMWVTVAQCLLGLPGATLSEIREVFSHPEGFNQCRRFLKNRSWDLTACRNTAVAAQTVARKASNKFAAIGSRQAAEIHGLEVLAPDITDNKNNKTRFIAIAAAPEYDETSGTTSITFSTLHKSGALCAVLESFNLAGINLSRIESRPVNGEKYRFFADLQANIFSAATQDALRQAAAQCDYFEVLGCY
ncbi:MAG: chorismate mutase [Oscillospiraceae bacterium]|nr:chorismate mutase [Oscillospiraceae bacterium]